MAQTNLTIRIDEELKHEAEVLFNKIGLNMSSAINVFFRKAVGSQSIPFELKAYDDDYHARVQSRRDNFRALQEEAITSGASNMTIDEVNELVKTVRQEKQVK